MEHASRGRRSGNKGVGARWRGRFRIFSARHCSRTKVSHAENSGMTMLFFFFGGCSGVGVCVDHRSGHSAPCHLRRDGTRGVGFCFFFGLRCRGEWEREHEGGLIRCAGRPQEWSFGAVPPQERWHEGGWFLFFLWRLLRCRGEWEREHEGGLIRCAGRPQEWSFGAVPPQERWHEGGWFLFFLWRLLRCRGEWEREHEGGLIRCAGRPQEWSFGAVPPQERWHEGGWFLFFLWRLLRCRGGILSHAKERTAPRPAAGQARRFCFGGLFHTSGEDGTRILVFCLRAFWGGVYN